MDVLSHPVVGGVVSGRGVGVGEGGQLDIMLYWATVGKQGPWHQTDLQLGPCPSPNL